MKEFTWEQVIEFLEDNQDQLFNHQNPSSHSVEQRKKDGENCQPCLMLAFFKNQGIDVSYVTYNGMSAYNRDEGQIAIISNPPEYTLNKIHRDHTGFPILKGKEILENITEQPCKFTIKHY